MPDEHAAQGTIAPTTVAAGAERRELDETGTVPHAGASLRRPSTEMPDEHAAQGTIAPTTVAAGAERRELDETGTVPHAGASPRRPSTEMPDEHAAQGSLTRTTVAAGAERRELDETGKVPQAGVASTSPRSPSTECRDEQAAQGICLASKTEADTCKLQAYLQQRGVFAATFLKPAVPSAGSIARIGATVAERRVFEEARADPPEDCSSGSEEETRASPTVSTHSADSSLQAQRQCPVVEHGAWSDDDEVLELGQEVSDGDNEFDEPHKAELEVLFDTIDELAEKDGRDWVQVRQIHQVMRACTTMSLGRLKGLLGVWESAGIIYRNDTRSEVALCESAMKAFDDKYNDWTDDED